MFALSGAAFAERLPFALDFSLYYVISLQVNKITRFPSTYCEYGSLVWFNFLLLPLLFCSSPKKSVKMFFGSVAKLLTLQLNFRVIIR